MTLSPSAVPKMYWACAEPSRIRISFGMVIFSYEARIFGSLSVPLPSASSFVAMTSLRPESFRATGLRRFR